MVCDTEEALQAAHFVSYRGPQTDRVEPCCGDLHTLFDIGLIAI